MFKENRIIIAFWLFIGGINFGFAFHLLPLNIALAAALVNLLFQALVFYSNYYGLFPRYFDMHDNRKFFFLSALLIIIATCGQITIEYFFFKDNFELARRIEPPKFIFIFFRSFLWLVLINLISTVFLMQKRIREQSEHTQKINEEKLKTELELLKAQINPHFLFNALNNIYSLAYMKSDQAPESILELSQMLRYVIEDCKNEKVPIKSEIEYIKNYITFQKMKSQEEQNISFDYRKVDNGIQIAPMLFIPFLENSFKYSRIEELNNAYIQIKLRSNKNELKFDIQNSKPENNGVKSGQGTGIKNVKQRLEIIYPDNFFLQIEDTKNEYMVNLGIILK
jgi:two-component system, LytTR family, sensor kinase